MTGVQQALNRTKRQTHVLHLSRATVVPSSVQRTYWISIRRPVWSSQDQSRPADRGSRRPSPSLYWFNVSAAENTSQVQLNFMSVMHVKVCSCIFIPQCNYNNISYIHNVDILIFDKCAESIILIFISLRWEKNLLYFAAFVLDINSINHRLGYDQCMYHT